MKRSLKQITSCILVMVLLISYSVSAYAKPFSDVPNSMDRVFLDAVNYVSDRGIINGTTPTKFSPNVGATRAMVVTVLFRLSGDTTYHGTDANHYIDVPSNSYYYYAVGWAAYHGIATGMAGNQFMPDAIVTWEQCVTFLRRYATYMGLPNDFSEDITHAADYGNVHEYARESISWAYTYGILLRDSIYANIYPQASLDRKTLALFIARLRRNVEGIVWDRDVFSFLNSYNCLLSAVPKDLYGNDVSSRYLISNGDMNRLRDAALVCPDSSTVLHDLIVARNLTWTGSCTGFALIVALDNYGKISTNNNCVYNCDTINEIPTPKYITNPKHIIVRDTSVGPTIPLSDIESKINMYHLSWQIPSIRNWSTAMTPNTELRVLKAGQSHSGIALFAYMFPKTNDSGQVELKGHTLVVFGRPIHTTDGFIVAAYDCRSHSPCTIMVTQSNVSWTGIVTYISNDGISTTNSIYSCKYINQYSGYDYYLDFDGYNNGQVTQRAIDSQIQKGYTLNDSSEIDFENHTVVQVTTSNSFQIKNAEGESFVFEDGETKGDMTVYGMDFLPGEPCTFAFIVDDSDSFTCTSLESHTLIQSFSVIGSRASGSIYAIEKNVNGWSRISIDSSGLLSYDLASTAK